MFSSGKRKNREINSRVLFSNTLTRQIWEDLCLRVTKIICSVRQELKLWSKNTKLNLSIIASVSYSNKFMHKDWNYRTLNADTLNLDENKFIYKKNYRWKKRYSSPKHARNGRNEESSRTTDRWRLCAEIKRKSWDNTKAHFSVARNARTDEFYEWLGRISRSGIKLQWKIVSLFQSTCDDSGYRPLLSRDKRIAAWHVESIWSTGKRCLVINFLRLIRPKIIFKEFIVLRHQVQQERFQCVLVQKLLSQEMKIKIEAQFQCRHLQEGRRSWVHYFQWIFRRTLWLDSKDSKFRNCNSINSLIPTHS